MNSEAPKIFKEEDFYGHKIVDLSELPIMAQNVFQKYYDEQEWKVGFIVMEGDGSYCYQDNGPHRETEGVAHPTHKVLIRVEKLEEELMDCEHMYGSGRAGDENEWTHYSFCPKCGKALK